MKRVKVDPMTGEDMVDPMTGEDMMEDDSQPDNGTPAQGMGDLKMAEHQPEPYKDPNFSGGFGQANTQAAAMVPHFLGDVGAAVPGIYNAAIQGIQDNPTNPIRAAGAIVKNEAQNLASPFHTFEKPIQTSSESLQRMGVPNTPMDPRGLPYGQFAPGGSAPIIGLADQAGIVADMFAPIPGVGAAKAIDGAEMASKAMTGAGKAAQNIAIRQAKSAIPINIPFARKGAEAETFLKEGLLSGGKGEAYSKASDLSKELGKQSGEIIKASSKAGETVDGLAIIKNLKDQHTSGTIETDKGLRFLEPSSKRLIDNTERLIKKISPNGDGVLNMNQANAVKKWLQRQADYPGKALQQGLQLTPEADAAGLTAADIGHEFRAAIESKVPDVVPVNARLSKLIPAKQAAGWKQAVRERQELVPLKAFVAVLGDLAGGHGAALSLLAMNTAWKSGRISQTMYNLGTKLIKAGSAAEKAKVERALEIATTKGMIKPEEFQALEGLGSSENPYAGYQAEIPYDKAKPQAIPPPQAKPFDPLDQLIQKPDMVRHGVPGYEGMVSPEDVAKRQTMAQADREAVVRQARPVRVPQAKEAPGGVQVLDQNQIKKQPYKPTIEKSPPKQVGQSRIGFLEANNRRIRMTQYIKETKGYAPTMGEVNTELKKLGDQPVPKIPQKEVVSRQFKGRRVERDLNFLADALPNGTPGYETKAVPVKEAPEIFTLHGEEFKKVKGGWDNLITYRDSKGRKYEFMGNEKIHMDPINQAKIDRLTKLLEKAKDPQTKKKIEAEIAKEIPF